MSTYREYFDIVIATTITGFLSVKLDDIVDTNKTNDITKLSIENNTINSLKHIDTLINLQELNLSNNNISGSLPAEWSSLVKLQILNLSNNNISGSLPTEWSSLVNLQYILLNNNQISGSLPPEWSSLVNLQYLLLNNNQISGSLPPEWSSFGTLYSMDISNNQISGSLPTEWSSLVNLQYMYLNNNQISGSLPAEWSSLGILNIMNLHDNQISGSIPIEFLSLNRLYILNLNNNHINDISSIQTHPHKDNFSILEQTIILDDVFIGNATQISIKGYNGYVTLIFQTGMEGTYVNGMLRWETIGNNTATWNELNFSGQATQIVKKEEISCIDVDVLIGYLFSAL
jgi:Leucine-rich repeat (LRR) protein